MNHPNQGVGHAEAPESADLATPENGRRSEPFAWGEKTWRVTFEAEPGGGEIPDNAVRLKEEGGDGQFLLIPQ